MNWQRLIYHPEVIYRPNVNYGLRQTLVLCLPAALGFAIGELRLGLMFSLIPACCNIASLDTPHQHFFRRLIIGGMLFAFSSFLTQQLLLWHIPLPAVMLGLALILGMSGAISQLNGRLLPAALIAAIFSLSMLGRAPIWQAPLMCAVGTLWYGVFNWLWFRLCKDQLIREPLSQLYNLLAEYCDVKYSLFSQHVESEKALPKLLDRQQGIMDEINQLYQQFNLIDNATKQERKRLLSLFQMALDLQEHITAAMNQPEKVQELMKQGQIETVLERNMQTISARMRTIADDILYHHRAMARFSAGEALVELEEIAQQNPDNPVLQFSYYHISHVTQILSDQRPQYDRELMSSQLSQPFWPALVSYLSFKSSALRDAARMGVTLAVGSYIGNLMHLPKPYWILLTIMLVTQNGYNATKVRIHHRALGTLVGLLLAAALLHFQIPEGTTLSIMLLITLISYLVQRKNYGLAVIGRTITAVYILQLLTGEGADFLVPRLLDTLIGCALAFASALWLWPQWQSGLLRKNAHQALASYQNILRILLKPHPDIGQLAYERIQVNKASNAVLSSLNQAMQEPGFNSKYLADMRLWATHSELIVGHINEMTILTREHSLADSTSSSEEKLVQMSATLAAEYLQLCEMAIQQCQQRLESDNSGGDNDFVQMPDVDSDTQISELERNLRRILSHLSVMHTVSSMAWQQQPHHGIWRSRKLRDKT
ncbi:YccS/YhfK family putative transporter [Yersinia pekkanenii]|uniref:YccS/YhfK family integral membrane protein n=1 Tax=Yersinia pekkanenii TaxID=1288385 RepID=A0A0T9PH93_9GAMM|nr:YccS/YhfK family putative transporter [Yersinia pekkanenii]CNH64965.1 YccS/YhfK family integral membrane protein [Yersinia pekkanenii]CRY67114.1 YccS/YhfK family integral membrane protein [Yersinia pekkanenii]